MSPDPGTANPLEGVRILELARVIAGPYAARMLRDLGADVVKVEPPAGDASRGIAPRHDRGMSWLYTFSNAGKRSIAIDLRKPRGAELVLELAARADAVIENFRPGVCDALGLGYAHVAARNPRCVYVSINGYGRDSALGQRRAYAPVMHAVTGILRDQAEYAGQPPAQLNTAHADTVTALHATVALLAALRVAEATGRGQHVEVPMFDAVLTTYSETGNALLDPPDDRRMNPIYAAGEHGDVAVAGAEQHIWARLSRHHAIADPAPGPVPVPEKARLRRAAIEAWMRAQPDLGRILEGLEAAGLACAPVSGLVEAVTGPIARERDLLVAVDDHRGGTRPLVRPAARYSGSQNRIRGAAPTLGQDADAILRDWLGYDPARIHELHASGLLDADPEASR